jgi:hypothetical protein
MVTLQLPIQKTLRTADMRHIRISLAMLRYQNHTPEAAQRLLIQSLFPDVG